MNGPESLSFLLSHITQSFLFSEYLKFLFSSLTLLTFCYVLFPGCMKTSKSVEVRYALIKSKKFVTNNGIRKKTKHFGIVENFDLFDEYLGPE